MIVVAYAMAILVANCSWIKVRNKMVSWSNLCPLSFETAGGERLINRAVSVGVLAIGQFQLQHSGSCARGRSTKLKTSGRPIQAGLIDYMKFHGRIILFFTLWFHIIFANTAGKKCNIVFVLTVWRRNFYDVQFELIKQQSALREFQEVCLIIFQNGNHVHVRETDKKSRSNISIYNIH